jgi:hypothetical protein
MAILKIPAIPFISLQNSFHLFTFKFFILRVDIKVNLLIFNLIHLKTILLGIVKGEKIEKLSSNTFFLRLLQTG